VNWTEPWEKTLVRRLYLLGVRPDHLTASCLGLLILAALLAPFAPVPAGLSLLAARVLDALRRALAVATGEATPAAAFVHSALERYGELAVLLGAWGRLARLDHGVSGGVLVLCALHGSAMLDYTRAGAEDLGHRLPGNRFERERLLALAFGFLLSPAEAFLRLEPGGSLAAGIALLAAGANVAAIVRTARCRRRLGG
jgi:hypothetical protein